MPFTETSVVLENSGNGVLHWKVVPTEAWASVVGVDSGALLPGSSALVALKSSATGLPPSTYSSTLTIMTNEVSGMSLNPVVVNTAVGSSNQTVPWTIQVVVALLFPTSASVRLTADSVTALSTFTVVNLAGAPIVAVIDTPSQHPWLTASVNSSIVKDADVLSVDVLSSFDFDILKTVPRNACVSFVSVDEACPLLSVTLLINITCWTEATADELAGNGTATIVKAGDQLSPLADVDTAYTQISLPPIIATVRFDVGKPSAKYSRCRLRSMVATSIAVFGTIQVGVALADGAGFSVPLNLEALQYVGLQFLSTSASEGTIHATVTSYDLDEESNEIVVSIRAIELGALRIVVLVSGSVVSGSEESPVVHVVSPFCDASRYLQQTLDRKRCICQLGRYSDGSSCLPCPAGTFQPRPQNITLPQYAHLCS
jgi:hypothetical protein